MAGVQTAVRMKWMEPSAITAAIMITTAAYVTSA